MTATVLTHPNAGAPVGPLGWLSAESWIKSLNATAEDRARGFDFVRVGIHGKVKHRLAWHTRDDGRRVYGPACHQGYNGDPADRVHPISGLAAGEHCNRLACVRATPSNYVPGYKVREPLQLELDLIVG